MYSDKPKENRPKISVIIPAYNVEEYLSKCLDSLIKQTLQEIEIIITDDESTDNSYKIASEYAQKDSRIILLRQKNAKQGAARNRGLEIAKGEYITFVDSDDWVNDIYLERLYNAAKKYDVNIAAASATRDYKNKIKQHLKFEKEQVFYGDNEIIKGLDMHLETHSKLYKFEPIKGLRFEENVFYEDGPYTIKAIHLEGSMVTVPEAHYHYVSNPNSTIKKKMDAKTKQDKISTSLQVIDFAEEYNIEIKNWPVIKERHLLWTIKHYKHYKDYYLFGIRLFSRQIPFDDKK